jgi:hypothetical protein
MNELERIATGLLTLLLLALAPALVHGAAWAQDAPPSFAERYHALLKEDRGKAPSFREATTAEERRAALEHMDALAPRLLDLIEQEPANPLALEALVEVVRTVNAVDSLTQVTWETDDPSPPRVDADRSADRAVVLLREHLQSAELGPLCLRMSYGLRRQFERFLRAALATNPQREVQALTCLSLAQFLNSRLHRFERIDDRPAFAERFTSLLGKTDFDELVRQDRAAARAEIEALFERAAETYGDVAHPYGGTIGEKARAELFEIRELSVGRTAPDIEGVDQHGQRFKLSDSRGKVVLLDFWQEF